MGLTLADTYYLKAKAATQGYYQDWEAVTESINYAISYDADHCPSLCLLGEVYAQKLGQFDLAFNCFDKVIGIDNTYEEVYPLYGKYLIWANQITRAKKLIGFGLSMASSNKGDLLWLLAYAEESVGRYHKALKQLKRAKKHTFNDRYFSFLEDEERRIRKKIKLEQAKGKAKSNAKTSAKQKRNT